MKNLLLTLTLALAACNESLPTAPADRPPTLGEMRAAPARVTLRYDPAAVPTGFWAAWRGLTTVELRGPEAGLDALPAALSLDQGFAELDDCLPDELDGTWTLGAGAFSLTTVPEAGESALTLTGMVTVHYFYENPNPPAGPTIGHRIVGSGTWTVTLGATCTGDDFAGGTTGTWTLEQEDAQTAAAVVAPTVGRRARLFVLAEDGQLTTVDGPLPTVIRLVGELR